MVQNTKPKELTQNIVLVLANKLHLENSVTDNRSAEFGTTVKRNRIKKNHFCEITQMILEWLILKANNSGILLFLFLPDMPLYI